MFTDAQIAFELKQAKGGTSVAVVCRTAGIAETCVRYGYRRILLLLRWEGWPLLAA